MNTVLLFKSSNTLHGILLSKKFSLLTMRLEHPTSPVLLTKNGPQKDIFQRYTTIKMQSRVTPI